MKNKLINKKILFFSLIPIAIIPSLSVSCAGLPTGSINKEEQSELLSSEEAKISLLNNWLTTTYTSLYVENMNLDSTTSKEEMRNTIMYYLDNLSWPTESTGKIKFLSNDNVNFARIDQSQKTSFENNLKEAYKFYISFKSTISEETESDGTSVPANRYFLAKSIEWKKNGLTTNVEIKDTNGKILSILDFNPGISYTGTTTSNGSETINENDFKILMATRGTLVYQNVVKLLLSEMYFLKATETQIKNATNYNKMTRNIASVDYINTFAYVENKNEKNDFSTYMLKKYMVENSPQFLWSYSAEDYSTSNTVASIISTQAEFNNIKTTKELKLSATLAPASNETANNAITNLQAFNSAQFNANSDATGDLTSSIENLKQFGSPKIGLLDTDTNMLFNFSELEAIKEARKHNNTNNGTNGNVNQLAIPSIKIKNSSNSKKSHSITVDDLEVSWINGTTIINTTNSNVFENTNGNIKQILTINNISYSPSKGNEKEINIDFTYSFNTNNTTTNSKNTNSTTYSFDYNFSISNWGETSSSQINKFENQYVFSGTETQVGIKIFNESTSLGINYYLRALPIWKNGQAIQIGNSDWYNRGYWTFEGTPWSTEAEQKKLIYFFILSDTNLYSNIQNFYLFNNFNVEGNNYELTSLISSLNLTKKTDDDRKNEGIIW